MAIFIMLRVNSKYKERKGTWKMIMMLSLIVGFNINFIFI